MKYARVPSGCRRGPRGQSGAPAAKPGRTTLTVGDGAVPRPGTQGSLPVRDRHGRPHGGLSDPRSAARPFVGPATYHSSYGSATWSDRPRAVCPKGAQCLRLDMRRSSSSRCWPTSRWLTGFKCRGTKRWRWSAGWGGCGTGLRRSSDPRMADIGVRADKRRCSAWVAAEGVEV